MQRQIAWLVVATTSAVVLAFLIPLGLLVRTISEDRALATASQEAQSVAALVATVRAHAPTASVVVLAAGGRDEEFLAWADLGISGYLELDASAEDLLAEIRDLLRARN